MTNIPRSYDALNGKRELEEERYALQRAQTDTMLCAEDMERVCNRLDDAAFCKLAERAGELHIALLAFAREVDRTKNTLLKRGAA